LLAWCCFFINEIVPINNLLQKEKQYLQLMLLEIASLEEAKRETSQNRLVDADYSEPNTYE